METAHFLADALVGKPDVAAMACVDALGGLVLGTALRDDDMDEAIEIAAAGAADLCSTPTLASNSSSEAFRLTEPADEALVMGEEWAHVLVRAPADQQLVIVGIAKATANIALLLAHTRSVAGMVPGRP